MASTFEHFVIATLIALLALTNKEKLRKYWHSREDDAVIGLDVATNGVRPGFAKVAVGYVISYIRIMISDTYHGCISRQDLLCKGRKSLTMPTNA